MGNGRLVARQAKKERTQRLILLGMGDQSKKGGGHGSDWRQEIFLFARSAITAFRVSVSMYSCFLPIEAIPAFLTISTIPPSALPHAPTIKTAFSSSYNLDGSPKSKTLSQAL